MIKELHIANMAVIEDTTLSFTSSHVALIGETGAGKSLIVGSLSLLKGAKADYGVVRDATKKSVVSALFDLSDDFVRLHPEVRDYVEEGNQLLLKRTLNPDRTSRYHINGEPVTLQTFREVSSHLIDIHSQGENWDLFDEHRHLGYLDRYAGKEFAKAMEAYRKSYDAYQSAKEDLRRFIETHKGLDREYLEFQVREIEKYHLRPHEIEDLSDEYNQLKDIEKLQNKYQDYQAVASLPEGSVRDVLYHIRSKLNAFQDTALQEQARKAVQSLAETIETLDEFDEGYRLLDKDPDRIDSINERLFELKGLMRKYGKTTQEILKAYDDFRNKLASIDDFESLRADKEARIEALKATCLKEADVLTDLRKKAKEGLEKAIGSEMSDLGLPKTGFKVEMKDKQTLSESGKDDVRFVVCLNAGLDYAPLVKAASGGESSRLMLSLKTVLNALNPYDLLVLDEIDTGVSGRIGSLIAKKISMISSSSQVLVISHLAQVVSGARSAIRISKTTRDNKTFTTATLLDEKDFITEIAKMLSGEKVTEAALKQAEELVRENRR